jgi:hypothetical protein
MRKAVQQDGLGAGISGSLALDEPLTPMSVTREKFVLPLLGCFPLHPLRNGIFFEMDENAFPELLDCGQPIRTLRNRRAAHRERHVLELSICGSRRRLEPGEAVETGHFPEPVHRHHILDDRQIKPRAGVAQVSRARVWAYSFASGRFCPISGRPLANTSNSETFGTRPESVLAPARIRAIRAKISASG